MNKPDLIVSSAGLPDLIVSGGTVPSVVTLNETFTVSWTVTNQGAFSALTDWYDNLSISPEFPEIQDALRYSINPNTFPGIPRVSQLAPGNSYTNTREITIRATPGNYYLTITTDRTYFDQYNNILPETNEDNNVFVLTFTVDNRFVDLVVSDASAPTSALVGQTIPVSWTVKNQGTEAANFDWPDIILISNDEFFTGGDDQYLYGLFLERSQEPLAAGSSYTITQNIPISSDIAPGDYYILFSTNLADEEVREGYLNNNVLAKPISIIGRDLVISDANVPVLGSLKERIAVSWTVTNQAAVSAFGNWVDRVYISSDAVLDSSDSLLGSRSAENNSPLTAGASYTATLNINLNTFPASLDPGSYYLLFTTDNVTNQSNNNNVLAKPIEIGLPDLVVTNFTSPTFANSGQSFSVSWTVENQSNFTTLADIWLDDIYISDDSVFNYGDTFIARRYANNEAPLAAGASYTATQEIIIPSELSTGKRYLFVVANSSFSQGESHEENNVVGREIYFDSPDLIVSGATAPSAATLGDSVTVSWTVTNQGSISATADWEDSVYLSTDDIFDYNDKLLVQRSAANDTPLAVGASYTVTENVVIPNVGEGDRYLLFITDNEYGSNSQAEAFESNNLRAVKINLSAPNLTTDQVINGTSSRDNLTGAAGNDTITGFQGADILAGGAGSDQFVYTSIRDAGDTITDFLAGTDKIVLTQLLENLTPGRLTYGSATARGYLSFSSSGNDTTVLIDVDGRLGRARPTELLTVQGVSESSLATANNFIF